MTLFRSIGYFTDHLDIFRIMLVLSRLSGNFSHHPRTPFSDHTDILQIIWSLFDLLGIVWDFISRI